MRKIGLLAAAGAVSLACVGAWLSSSTHARVDAPTQGGIDTTRITMEARDLPVQTVVDFATLD